MRTSFRIQIYFMGYKNKHPVSHCPTLELSFCRLSQASTPVEFLGNLGKSIKILPIGSYMEATFDHPTRFVG